VTPGPDGAFSIDDLAAAVTRRTGAVALSAVQYASGLRSDLRALRGLCRDRGLILAVNGSQALGQIALDVEELGIDFLCGAGHKWMMGGCGVGLFYGRTALLEETPLPLAGWLSTEQPMAMDPFAGARLSGSSRVKVARGARFRADASALELGVGSFATLAGFGAALELLEALGLPAIEAHNAKLQRLLRAGLRQRGFVPNAPDDRCAGICVFPVKGDAQAAWRSLDARDIRLTVRGGGLRVSTHLFNDEGELERFFWALDQAKLSPAEGRS
jgi:cysteine desulfurase / selenocysteine lyase